MVYDAKILNSRFFDHEFATNHNITVEAVQPAAAHAYAGQMVPYTTKSKIKKLAKANAK